MALHHLVYDCAVKRANDVLPKELHQNPIKRVDLTAEEEAAERARWAMEDAKNAERMKNTPKSAEQRIAELEATVETLKAKAGV